MPHPPASPALKYLSAYSEHTRAQVSQLIADRRLGQVLKLRYPQAHTVRTDKALYEYIQGLRAEWLRNSEPINRVAYDSRIHVIQHALGLHTTTAVVQGARLKARHDIRIATLFRDVPLEFLRMIAVHELAHVREKQHDKAFYQLCCHMEPDYHQFEFDVRLYLTHLELSGEKLWGSGT
jgi:hypothetical protein